MRKLSPHTFHIPVLGIGYSIDTPVKVAHLGINSVVSLLDDMLMEKIREFHSLRLKMPFQPIPEKTEDCRARRITAYLNLLDLIVKQRMADLKTSLEQKQEAINQYFESLHEKSIIRQKFETLKHQWSQSDFRAWIQENLTPGAIDVNIMTKVDKENYTNNQKLPVQFNDGHAALRGFANSTLESSVVFSAGLNPALYQYLATFDDFFPQEDHSLKKKIILKVSDFRSAFIQGKYLAKKGLWVSEFRIESGLNCGGHAFPTDGQLLGPVLEEFRTKREELTSLLFELYSSSLRSLGKPCPATPLPLSISAQGGVGTAEEHEFLLDYYHLDSVGWGTPFLLVPEAVSVDEHTLSLLCKAGEDDIVLSNISPLGIPFHNLKGNTKDMEKEAFILGNTPGNPCPKKYAALNREFGDKTLCTASRKYQRLKLDELTRKELPVEEYHREFGKITDKSCICVGLGTAALLVNGLDTKTENTGVSVCPGPNMAYFSKKATLSEMIDHIYGRINLIMHKKRPHMFVRELSLYLDWLRARVTEQAPGADEQSSENFSSIIANLERGISYYMRMFNELTHHFREQKAGILHTLAQMKAELMEISELRLQKTI